MNYTIKQGLNYLDYMQQYRIHSLLAKICSYHQYSQETMDSFTHPKFIYHDFSLFSEGELALERIEEAIENDEKICIYGDYDCDGMLATSILVDAFRQRGKEVGYYIPKRDVDGYGMNKNRVQQMAQKGYNLIITVDNGVKAFEAIECASELGIDVIVSDHHTFDEDLPEAHSIIHTKLSPNYPFKEISGGFVAYKIAHAMLKKHDKYLFSLAAITTISDMMPLHDENRSVVKNGLLFMKENKYPSIECLLSNNQDYTVTTIGFTIAPKINSFGRLFEIVNPNNVVKHFVRPHDNAFLQTMSNHASSINSKRQQMTTTLYNQVVSSVTPNQKFLYCYKEDLHEGLVGLIAGKYTRDTYQPSFVMVYDEVSGNYKGSARGIVEIPLGNIFEYCSDLLVGYGGHMLAGGFQVSKENVEALQQRLETYFDEQFSQMPVASKAVLEIEEEDVSIAAIKQLELLEPLGNGNEEICVYLKDVIVQNKYALSNGKHTKFMVNINQQSVSLLCFNSQSKYDHIQPNSSINAVGKLSVSSYQGKESINMIVEDII